MARKPVRRPKKPKPPLLQRLRTDFLTGLVVVLPMFLTAYLVWWFVGFVDDKVVPLIPRRYDPENIFGRNIFGFGLVLFVTFTTLVGALAKNLIGRQILQFGEPILEPHPDRKTDLQRPETDRGNAVHPVGQHLPAGLPRRVPAQGHLVGRLHVDRPAPRNPRAHRRPTSSRSSSR